MSKIFTTKSSDETVSLGEKLGAMLLGGEFIALSGDLGGGKTQFTKGIAKGLGVTETVISPTFMIERVYAGKKHVLHHFDLYRVSNDREISEEIDEITGSSKNVLVAEWPENMNELLPTNRLQIDFEYQDGDTRQLTVTAVGDKYSRLLESL